jgi:hypothetical protein
VLAFANPSRLPGRRSLWEVRARLSWSRFAAPGGNLLANDLTDRPVWSAVTRINTTAAAKAWKL